MDVHNVTIFARKSFTPQFDTLSSLKDIVLHISSGNSNITPKLTIFFADIQEATNFKNAVIQSWEMFLRETKEEKS